MYVGEHWHTQRVLTNHFFDSRVVRLGENERDSGDWDNSASISHTRVVHVPVQQLMYG